MAWGPFKNLLSREQPAPPSEPAPQRPVAAPQRAVPPSELKRISLDAIGQRDELMRQRIQAMIDRLEDVRSLQDDFAGILDPLVGISNELPRATMRIAELETTLAQERQAHALLRQEAIETGHRLSQLTTELSNLTLRADQAETELIERQALLDEHQSALAGRIDAQETLERQLFGETEQKNALFSENKALRAEAQATDSALARSEHNLLEAREHIGILEQDNRRLLQLNEDQALRIDEMSSRLDDLEGSSENERQRIRQLETQVAHETSERQRIESQYETEVGAHRSERAALSMKLEAANSRVLSTEQLLSQARNQLREKDEAHRMAERSLKEGSIARTTAERRLEALQADLARQNERFLEMQRLRAELNTRCEMLVKALAAKDAAIEQATARNAALSDRIEQINSRHEAGRAELEIANRRLTEDLEKERSERALAQGALDIARESRGALQKQYDALKRAGRGWRDGPEDGNSDGVSNVRPFQPPPR